MSRIADHLANYAAYHRDGRNVATHMLGIPLIVLAIQLLLARPVLMDDPTPVTPALAVSAMAVWYYLWLDLRLGLVMAVLLSLGVVLTEAVAAAFPASRIVLAVGVFVVGWVLQFIGHWFEGRKPAFFDELVSLLTGELTWLPAQDPKLTWNAEFSTRWLMTRDVGFGVAARAQPAAASLRGFANLYF